MGLEDLIQIQTMLINYQDIFGHVYNNVLTGAVIIDFNGNILSSTKGISIQREEVKKLKELFDQEFNEFTWIKLGGKKFIIIHYERSKHAYLAYHNFGATVAKTKNYYIIGFYDTQKTFLYDGKKLPQCVGMCNTVVEETAKKLICYGF